MVSDSQISQFISDGYLRVDSAFSEELAAGARDILWRDLKLDRKDPSTWTKPVIRLGMYADPPFLEAANSPALVSAYDSLVGKGNWLAPRAVGTFPVRFPCPSPPTDTGWHVDMSLDFHKPDFMQWRINLNSSGRLLLMLFLFSDVSENDAPTKIRAGSHLSIARKLAPYKESGLILEALAADGFKESSDCKEVSATGPAGTVYLCHPFLVHSAQAHRGSEPRFMAQPPLLPSASYEAQYSDSPMLRAIRSV